MFLVAVLGLATVSGCQGGIGRFLPGMGAETDPLVGAKARKAAADKPNIPAPKITEQNYAQVQVAIGDSLAKEGNFEAAQSAYEAALRNDDSLARAYHRLALVYEKTDRGSEAKDLFLRAIKLDPKNAEIVCDYGYWCYLRQDWKESQKQFQRALQLDPGLKRAHNNLGLVYARTKRPDDALKHFTLAGLSPADARANLAFVYLTEQRMPEAKIELERAVAATPSSEKAQHVLADLKKFESTDKPESVPPLTANSPAPPSPIDRQFTPALPPATAATPPVAVASKPADEFSLKRRTNMPDLPTQKLSPVLFDYPGGDTVSKPASPVELTEFADRPPGTSTVTDQDTPSPGGEPPIRFLPPPADPPHGA